MSITYEETIEAIASIELQLEAIEALDVKKKVAGAIYLAMHMFHRDFDEVINDVERTEKEMMANEASN